MFKRLRKFGAALSVALVGSLAVAGQAMAVTTIDTAAVIEPITAALVAVAAIGGAFLGFKYLKKVWNRL